MAGSEACIELGAEQSVNPGQLVLRSAWARPACTGHLEWAVPASELAMRQMHVGVFPVHLSAGLAGVSRNMPRPGADKPQLMWHHLGLNTQLLELAANRKPLWFWGSVPNLQSKSGFWSLVITRCFPLGVWTQTPASI